MGQHRSGPSARHRRHRDPSTPATGKIEFQATGQDRLALAATTAVRRAVILGAMPARPPLPADLLLEPPRSYGASLHHWLRFAAVVAELDNAGVIVRARANRVFRLADLATLVREWMQAYDVDAVFATSDGRLFSITPDDRAWRVPRRLFGVAVERQLDDE